MDKDQEIKGRVEAAKAGLLRYKGSPCWRGHSGERYTSTGGCTECSKEQALERHKRIRELLDAAK